MTTFRPVLLLGPGRGGTTLLYKTLALHPRAAFISNFDVRPFTRAIAGPVTRLSRYTPSLRRAAWFAGDGQAYLAHRNPLQRAIPVPVEGEPLYRQSGLTIEEYDSPLDEVRSRHLRTTFSRLQHAHGGDVLLLKRTANNRRLRALHPAFPGCRNVVLWRDGRAVVSSLLNVGWWLDHEVWWAGNKTPRQMNLDRPGSIELAAKNWLFEVAAIRRGLADLAPTEVLYVKYEDLLAAPREHIRRILAFIGLNPTPDYMHAVDSLQFRADGQGWRRRFSPAEQQLVERLCEPSLRELGYI